MDKNGSSVNRPIALEDNSPETTMHETIHNMRGGEFQAYSGMMAAGYGVENLKNILGYESTVLIDEKSNRKKLNLKDELTSELRLSAPKSFDFNKYLDVETRTTVEDLDGLINAMINYGKDIIGNSEENNK